MLDGRVQLGLYRQHMWDALLWTVMVAPDSLPRVVPAHNGVITSTLSVVVSQAQLGFEDPELQLRKVSRTDATLCDNRTCDTIRCAEATRSCERIVVK
jgi:hypothetical protein